MITTELSYFLTTSAIRAPIVIVCIIAMIILLTKRIGSPGQPPWALLGFGLALVSTIAMPLAEAFAQHYVRQNGSPQGRVWIFSVLAIISSLLHAAVYALLLAAIVAGRSNKERS